MIIIIRISVSKAINTAVAGLSPHLPSLPQLFPPLAFPHPPSLSFSFSPSFSLPPSFSFSPYISLPFPLSRSLSPSLTPLLSIAPFPVSLPLSHPPSLSVSHLLLSLSLLLLSLLFFSLSPFILSFLSPSPCLPLASSTFLSLLLLRSFSHSPLLLLSHQRGIAVESF